MWDPGGIGLDSLSRVEEDIKKIGSTEKNQGLKVNHKKAVFFGKLRSLFILSLSGRYTLDDSINTEYNIKLIKFNSIPKKQFP